MDEKKTNARLVDLLNVDMSGCNGDYAEEMAEYLASQGVIIPVHCGECEYYNAKKSRCDHPSLDWDVECFAAWLNMEPTDFCSHGECKVKKQKEKGTNIKYRSLLSLTDDEIRFIVNEIFDAEKIENIQRHEDDREITCDITTGGWCDGEAEWLSMTDELRLREPTPTDCGISIDFSIDSEDIKRWKQFCLAKGCNKYLKDNPYIESEND